MAETAAAGKITPADADVLLKSKPNISEIFKIDNSNTLVWDGYKPDGTKNQYWDKGKSIDYKKHLEGLSQGGNPAYKNEKGEVVCMFGVIDFDKKLPAKEVAAAAFKTNTGIIPFQSPSGRWHLYFNFSKECPVKLAHNAVKEYAEIFEKHIGHKADKVLPTENGSMSGINLPFCNNKQYPYDPRGNKYTAKQYLQRLKLNYFPVAASLVGMKSGEGSRYQALLMACVELHQAKYSDEQISHAIDFYNGCFSTKLNDSKYIWRLKNKKPYKKYNPKTDNWINWIKQFTGVQLENIKPKDDQDFSELEVQEHTGEELIYSRAWVLQGWLMEKCLTVLVGQPGIGKTVILHMLAWCLATGAGFFGKPILIRGNVLIIAAEETINEMNIRFAAIKKHLGGELDEFKIYKRGLEQDLKLVKFKASHAEKTKQYNQLKRLIKSKNIKHIILDPLINFQQGSYDENSNQHMEEYIKGTLIPLTFINAGTIITGHHSNKISMITVDQDSKDIEVDPQSALTAARGASSLIGAARFVLTMQPMLKKIWTKFKEHVKDGSNFIHYAGIIEAKSNYNLVADDIAWLKKNTVEVDVIDHVTKEKVVEKTGVFSLSTLHEITKSKIKLKAAENELFVRNNMPFIKTQFDKAGEDKITLNSVVVELAARDPRMADSDVKEATIRTDIRRKLINGFGGAVDNQKGNVERTGLQYEDGYNYWYTVELSGKTQQWFIERGRDFKR